mmetsp:Transcript_84061/g.195493  ORF Transcript_84061/g.195493 Transcript_84061/m.195493 type:complete len:255 (+) Transcript_84061:59-823(+)
MLACLPLAARGFCRLPARRCALAQSGLRTLLHPNLPPAAHGCDLATGRAISCDGTTVVSASSFHSATRPPESGRCCFSCKPQAAVEAHGTAAPGAPHARPRPAEAREPQPRSWATWPWQMPSRVEESSSSSSEVALRAAAEEESMEPQPVAAISRKTEPFRLDFVEAVSVLTRSHSPLLPAEPPEPHPRKRAVSEASRCELVGALSRLSTTTRRRSSCVFVPSLGWYPSLKLPRSCLRVKSMNHSRRSSSAMSS